MAAVKFGDVDTEYDPPCEAAVRATMLDWLSVRDRNQFIAMGVILSAGLRLEEVTQTRWGMFTLERRQWMLDSRSHKVTVKNKSGRFVVRPIDPFWRVLNRVVDAQGWRGADDDLIFGGQPNRNPRLHVSADH